MKTGAVTYHKRDLTAALDCARKAGIEIARIEIERGKVILITGKPGEPEKRTNAFEDAEF